MYWRHILVLLSKLDVLVWQWFYNIISLGGSTIQIILLLIAIEWHKDLRMFKLCPQLMLIGQWLSSPFEWSLHNCWINRLSDPIFINYFKRYDCVHYFQYCSPECGNLKFLWKVFGPKCISVSLKHGLQSLWDEKLN